MKTQHKQFYLFAESIANNLAQLATNPDCHLFEWGDNGKGKSLYQVHLYDTGQFLVRVHPETKEVELSTMRGIAASADLLITSLVWALLYQQSKDDLYSQKQALFIVRKLKKDFNKTNYIDELLTLLTKLNASPQRAIIQQKALFPNK